MNDRTFIAATWNMYYKSTPEQVVTHARALKKDGVTLILAQEVDSAKIAAMAREGWKGVRHPKASNAIFWLPEVWEKAGQQMLTLAEDYVPHKGASPIHTASPYVRLRHRVSSNTIWTLSYHLPSRVQRKNPDPARIRVNKQAIAKMDQMASYGRTVLFGGDDNVDERHGSWPWMINSGMKYLKQVAAPAWTHGGRRKIDDFRLRNILTGPGYVLTSSSDHRTHVREFAFKPRKANDLQWIAKAIAYAEERGWDEQVALLRRAMKTRR